MKLKTSLFVLTLTASTALAQSVMTPINMAKGAAKASSARTAQSNAAMNEQQAAPATSPSAPAKNTPFSPKVATKPATPASRPAAAKPGVAPAAAMLKAGQPAAAPQKAETTAKVVQPEMKRPPKDARDPFISIIRTDKSNTAQCISGKKCLVIGEIVFRGIMKSSESTIAVVENPEKKTYFLRENDPVFNGNVVRITGDSIVFREQVIDRAGRKTTREITKHVNPRPIA